jgi:hypothetical protein
VGRAPRALRDRPPTFLQLGRRSHGSHGSGVSVESEDGTAPGDWQRHDLGDGTAALASPDGRPLYRFPKPDVNGRLAASGTLPRMNHSLS